MILMVLVQIVVTTLSKQRHQILLENPMGITPLSTSMKRAIILRCLNYMMLLTVVIIVKGNISRKMQSQSIIWNCIEFIVHG